MRKLVLVLFLSLFVLSSAVVHAENLNNFPPTAGKYCMRLSHGDTPQTGFFVYYVVTMSMGEIKIATQDDLLYTVTVGQVSKEFRGRSAALHYLDSLCQ